MGNPIRPTRNLPLAETKEAGRSVPDGLSPSAAPVSAVASVPASIPSAEVDRLKRLLAEATPGPLNPCTHLKSIEADRACGCGYRGGVWTADGEHILFTMGEPVDCQFPGLEAPRIDREQEIASAQLLVALYDNAAALIALAASTIEARRGETPKSGSTAKPRKRGPQGDAKP